MRYEVGAIGEAVNKETGELIVRDFDFVARVLDERIAGICRSVDATKPPILFLTGDAKLLRGEYTPNFREGIAVGKAYKGTRKGTKPYHYRNLTAYIMGRYNTVVANGCEADDLIAIEQYGRRDANNTIICTRDKDLRMVPGWQYGWECGKQGEFGPVEYDDIGNISLHRPERKPGRPVPPAKIIGGGKAFFFAQLLVGDSVDNIGGLKRFGPVRAFEVLAGCRAEEDYKLAVLNVYRENAPENCMELLEEQSKLLWIVRERDADGGLVHYKW